MMKENYTIDNIIAGLIVVFGTTSLIIFNRIRKHDLETVDSIVDKKYWWLCYDDLDLKKYLQVYKNYHNKNGFDIVLILNIGSFMSACIFVFLILLF